MENRHGLIVDTHLTQATGAAEREAAVEMVAELPGNYRVTVGGDKAYETQGFVADLRAVEATPQVAQNTRGQASAIDGRTARHEGEVISQRRRKRERRFSAGRKRSTCSARCGIGASTWWAGSSPLRR